MDFTGGFVGEAGNFTNRPHDRSAEFGQKNPFRRKFETGGASLAQDHANARFKPLERKADGGLLERYPVRCFRYPARLRDFVKYL
jgi:hypothetical protein